MKRWLVIVAFMSGGTLAMSSPLLIYKTWADGWCCDTVSLYEGCFGCVGIDGAFIHVGVNPVQKCETTPSSQECVGRREPCYDLNGTQLFSDAQCAIVIGSINISRSVSQCNSKSDACGGE